LLLADIGKINIISFPNFCLQNFFYPVRFMLTTIFHLLNEFLTAVLAEQQSDFFAY